MDHFDEIELEDCPCCGGVGSIEEEGVGACMSSAWTAAPIRRSSLTRMRPSGRTPPGSAAANWNLRKVISPGPGE